MSKLNKPGMQVVPPNTHGNKQSNTRCLATNTN